MLNHCFFAEVKFHNTYVQEITFNKLLYFTRATNFLKANGYDRNCSYIYGCNVGTTYGPLLA